MWNLDSALWRDLMDKEHILDYQDCKYLKKNIFISPVETVYRPIAHSPA